MRRKLDVAHTLVTPRPTNGRELDLPTLARCAAASDRFVKAFDTLERTETIARKVRSYAGDSPPIRRLVDLAQHQLHLAKLEVDSVLDGDHERATRLRRRYWLEEGEYLILLLRLARELQELTGWP